MGEVMENADPLFEFVHFVKPAPRYKEELDEFFMKQIFSQWNQQEELLVDILHTKLEDFLLSNSFVIKIDGNPIVEMQKPPTMKQIMDKIIPQNEYAFLQTMSTAELEFRDQAGRKTKELIIDFLEGSVVVDEKHHFKRRKMWYILQADHFGQLCEDMKNVIKNHVMQNDSEEGQLPHPWAGGTSANAKAEKVAEALYCRTYSNELTENCENYLVFDQITPLKIEPCDILQYTDKTVYMYHVKETFGNNTRAVCSQILNSAALFRDFLSSSKPSTYLEKLWKEATEENDAGWRQCLKRRMDALGKDGFYNIFRKRKMVFVYAYLPKSGKSFSDWLEKTEIPLEQIEIDKLKEAGYMNEHERLTGKFYCDTQVQFIRTLTGFTQEEKRTLHKKLLPGQFSSSTIGKFEVVKLAQNLKELSFEFRICEMRRPKAGEGLPKEEVEKPSCSPPEKQNGNQSTNGESSTVKRKKKAVPKNSSKLMKK